MVWQLVVIWGLPWFPFAFIIRWCFFDFVGFVMALKQAVVDVLFVAQDDEVLVVLKDDDEVGYGDCVVIGRGKSRASALGAARRKLASIEKGLGILEKDA